MWAHWFRNVVVEYIGRTPVEGELFTDFFAGIGREVTPLFDLSCSGLSSLAQRRGRVSNETFIAKLRVHISSLLRVAAVKNMLPFEEAVLAAFCNGEAATSDDHTALDEGVEGDELHPVMC